MSRVPVGCRQVVVGAALLLSLGGPLVAQPGRPPEDQKDMTLDAAARQAVVGKIAPLLGANYVFPDKAKVAADDIARRLASKEYENITSASAFAIKLTDDLQSTTHDKHLRVRYSAEVLPPDPPEMTREQRQEERRKGPTPQEIDEARADSRRVNFGFKRAERLDGNIGYLKLDLFHPALLAGDTAAAAMNFLADTDALIIDLRENGGGDPSMVQLLCSYFFPAGAEVHLNDLYFRPDDETRQFWTLPTLPGKRYVDKDVYILTSNYTFSGAEEFSYNMKNLKRATIVGETTGGGAHPGGPHRLNEHFFIIIPSGRAINPITKTNWEGTGVSPDVATTAAEALPTAELLALKKQSASEKDPRALRALEEARTRVEKELEELKAHPPVPEKPRRR